MFVWVNILEWRIVGWMSSLHKGHLYFLLIFLVLMWQTLDWLSWKIAQTYKPLRLIIVTNFQNMGLNTLVVIFSVSVVQLFRCCLLRGWWLFIFFPKFHMGMVFSDVVSCFKHYLFTSKISYLLNVQFVLGENGSIVLKVVHRSPKCGTNP